MSTRKKTRRTQGVLAGRSARVVQQVLVASVAELAASGYRGFRMDVVSTQAKVNKTTIYRRWPTKQELVLATVESMRERIRHSRLPDTGSLEQDLIGAFRRRSSFKSHVEGQAWARLLAERHDPEVGAIIGDAVEERSRGWYTMVERAIARRELPRGTDSRLLLRMLGAIVDGSNADASGRFSPRLLELAVRTVIAGARAGSLVSLRAASRARLV